MTKGTFLALEYLINGRVQFKKYQQIYTSDIFIGADSLVNKVKIPKPPDHFNDLLEKSCENVKDAVSKQK